MRRWRYTWPGWKLTRRLWTDSRAWRHIVLVVFKSDPLLFACLQCSLRFPCAQLKKLLCSPQHNDTESRDHNFQLPVCNNFSRKSFRFKWIFIVSMFSWLPVFIFYACFSVYFTVSTIAMPLLLCIACTFVTCCAVNTSYSPIVPGT